jgi:hypothetical protein
MVQREPVRGSLLSAIVVASPENGLGFDPSTDIADFEFPTAVHDFIRMYEHAIK